jgi:hypothetical protein
MMNNDQHLSRRTVLKSSVFGLLALSLPGIVRAGNIENTNATGQLDDFPLKRYPAIEDHIVSEVVGVSHFNLDRLKVLVDNRPELARATWDWGFGDWETAIGAASHVGRKDIVRYLLSKGARPDLFTFAMLGAYEVVQSMIVHQPGIQQIAGPHGISLLQHARMGSLDDTSKKEKQKYEKLINYLESLGDADVREKYLSLEQQEKSKYLGDYKYGEGAGDGFSIRLNMREMLSLGRIGAFGGALLMTSKNRYIYNGCPSTRISFTEENGVIVSMTVTEPDFELTAVKMK